MSFEATVTECDFDPAAIQFADEMRRQNPSRETDFSIDGMQDSIGERFLRLFRREG